MISPAFCRMMARYNAWQNAGYITATAKMDDTALREDRGAFFGSIFATLNHLLWGDAMWMSRFDGGERPDGGIAESTRMTATPALWRGARKRMDQRITEWTRHLREVDLAGDLHWVSGALGREVSRPMSLCVAHFFNHQTHHRGQVHAMMGQAGISLPDTDIFVMETTG